MVKYVSSRDLHRQLAETLRGVEAGHGTVVVRRHEKSVVAIVSMDDLKRIWAAENDELFGPVNPETGRRRGGLVRAQGLVSRALGG
jgi:antitoxin (DNA-binding transcriptional repressor) of toxin-antitoxin stability system